jgi:uncharacterized protein YlxW (UPF0749 family)
MTIINRIFEQLPFSIGSASKRQAVARDITRALPDVEASQARIAELEARVEQVIKQRNHARKTIGSQKRRLESEIAVLEKVVTALKAKP